MTREFERWSAGDGRIIGRNVYDVDSHELIGVPQLQTRHPQGGWVVIVKLPDRDNPVHMRLYEVLIEVDPRSQRRGEPAGAGELPNRSYYLEPADTPERQKLRERATREGAQDMTREPGVSDVDVEPQLPHEGNGVDYSGLPRPQGPLSDPKAGEVEIHPEGKPLGRGKDTGGDTTPAGDDTAMRTGGTITMASVGEVKAAIDAALMAANEGAQAAHAAIEKVQEAQQMMAVAVDGSGHDSVATAAGELAAAVGKLEEAIQQVASANENATSYSSGL